MASTGWLARLSLADREVALGEAMGKSAIVGAAVGTTHWLHDRLRGWIAGSVFARHSEALAIASVCLLFLASPFVGTGMNAILVLLALGLVVFRLFAQPDTRGRFSALDLTVIAFIAIHVVATGFSYFLVPSLKGLAKMTIYWGAYFAFRQVIQTKKAFYLVVGALLTAGLIEGGYGIYQWFIGVEPLANWEDPETENPLTRVYSTLMNPNLLGGYLLPIFPLAVVAAIVWKHPGRFLAAATALVAPICIWFTYSRGAFLGLAATVMTFLVLGLSLSWPKIKASRKLQLGVGLGLAAVFGAVVLRIATNPALQTRIASIFTLRGHSSNSFRMNVWMGVWDMIQHNWLWGIGVGNAAFRKMYSLFMISGFEALGAYNVFLEVWAELGIFGLLIFLWLLVAFVGRALYTFWRGAGEARWWAAAIVAALVGTFVLGMVDTVFYRPAVQLQFWLLLAMIVALAPKERPSS